MKRIIQLDGLRALAFLAVFANHAGPVPLMWIGVDAFFVMSGFLITSILLGMKGQPAREFFGKFYARRARRILPPYCLSILLAVALGSQVQWRSVWIWMALFSSNISAAFHPMAMGPMLSLWSLAVEEHFYLVWPLIVFSFERRTLRRVLIALLIVTPALRAAFTPLAWDFGVIFMLTPFRVDLLAAGSLIALYWERDPRSVMSWHRRAKWIAIWAGLCFAAPALLLPAFRAKANSLVFNTLGYSLAVLTFTAVVIYALTLTGGPAYRFLTNKPLVWLGTISYMCYLVHHLFISLFEPGHALQMAAAFAMTIAFSALSWRFVEAPILGRIRKNRQPLPLWHDPQSDCDVLCKRVERRRI